MLPTLVMCRVKRGENVNEATVRRDRRPVRDDSRPVGDRALAAAWRV